MAVAGRLPMTAGVNAVPFDTKVARVMSAMRAGIGPQGRDRTERLSLWQYS